MICTLSTTEAADMLYSDNNASWSRAGAYALVEYLEELEDSTGEPMEFDRVAIRCDFAEYASLEDWALEYHGTEHTIEALEALGVDEEIAMGQDQDAIDEAIREYLRDHTTLIEFDGGIIVGSF